MDRAYWDNLADNYEDEIFSVLEHDEAGLIRQHIEDRADPAARAADLGCGTGNFLPLLASAFGAVEACDLSAGLLDTARRRARDLDHIRFHHLDLASDVPPFAAVDLALCVNVLIMPSLDVRLRAWRTVTGQVRRGGTLVLVVPSLESTLYTSFRRVDWCLREGMDCREAVADSLPRAGSLRDVLQGLRPIDGIRTKHYLKEELAVMIQDHQMKPLAIQKLCYPWTTEFADPPAWMESPRPWDWLVVARRD